MIDERERRSGSLGMPKDLYERDVVVPNRGEVESIPLLDRQRKRSQLETVRLAGKRVKHAACLHHPVVGPKRKPTPGRQSESVHEQIKEAADFLFGRVWERAAPACALASTIYQFSTDAVDATRFR